MTDTDDAEMWRRRGQRAAKKIGFKLPDGITMARGPASAGVAFYFRHRELGEIGRVRVLDDGRGHGRLLGEVAGDESDPLTARRAELLGPLIQQVHHLLDESAGVAHRPGNMLPEPRSITEEPRGGYYIKLMLCERCEKPVARLIFATLDAKTKGDFEDVARKTYSICAEQSLPTWVIGPGDRSDILSVSDPMDIRSAVMQIWPNHGELFESSPGQFNKTIQTLQESHCGRQTGRRNARRTR